MASTPYSPGLWTNPLGTRLSPPTPPPAGYSGSTGSTGNRAAYIVMFDDLFV